MKLLFLCTGNYYRSRFAEEYFNRRAEQIGLPWRADSAGLRQKMSTDAHDGPMSPLVWEALSALGMEPQAGDRFPRLVCLQDLQEAAHIVALNEREHRPMLEALFPEWAARVEYWDVEDLEVWEPQRTFNRIIERVEEWLERPAAVSAFSERS